MRESASLDVLAGESHSVALLQQTWESQTLRSREVDIYPVVYGFVPDLENLLQTGMHSEIRRQCGDLGISVSQVLQIKTLSLRSVLVDLHLDGDFLGLAPHGIWLVSLRVLEGLLEPFVLLFIQFFNFLLRDDSFLEQLLLIQLAHGLHLLDLLVHDRLSEQRLIQLIVSEATVSDQIDHKILLKLFPIKLFKSRTYL